MSDDPLWRIAVTFSTLSLLAIGGANAILPDLHRQVVDGARWMTDAEFVNAYALAQAAPGPNVLVVSLIGLHVAGAWGVVVATLAMALPSGLLAFAVGRFVARSSGMRWVRVAQAALVPITLGLILSSGSVMARAADRDALTLALTIGTAVFVFATEKSPLWALATGAALGVAPGRLGAFG